MHTKAIINREIETLPENILREIYDFILFLKLKENSIEQQQTHLASESTMSKDWNLKEEEEAWKDL
jgi:hypothetical protein